MRELNLRLFVFACFRWKREVFFKVRLCISAFRNRKDGRSKECKQKIFAAQTPQRKRGYEEDFAYRNKVRLRNFKKSSFCTVHKTVLRNRRTTGARMGLVSK